MDELTLSAPILFISDAHLGGFAETKNDRIESELIQLVNYCERNEIRLAVLGDLFDYWMEFPDYIPSLGRRLLDRFEEYNQALGPTLYITGNHDNWTRGHLSDRGFHVVSEYVKITVNEQQLLLLHGDGLADSSFGLPRPFLHRLLRHPGFVKLYQRVLPPRIGLQLMKYFSKFNRWINRPEDNRQVLSDWAERQLQHTEIDLIISGHDHIPRMKHFAFGSYINLGTFYNHRTMALYNNHSADLVSWETGTQSLQPFDSTITIDE
ncbi:UDP-2,3-diacylglucosamine diphosphatase [Fodinibius sp.]|uniref:UDP-2,3-diacylglucosamine diphosphatase n=1 Tax=Fodinibius sp. TaxID=1872440 RepID=UPI003564E003